MGIIQTVLEGIVMALLEVIRKILGLQTSEPSPLYRQREEGAGEILIFVIDESYDRIGEYVNWDDYAD